MQKLAIYIVGNAKSGRLSRSAIVFSHEVMTSHSVCGIQEKIQGRIHYFGQGGPSEILTPGGGLSSKFAQNCMILKKGGPGPLDLPVESRKNPVVRGNGRIELRVACAHSVKVVFWRTRSLQARIQDVDQRGPDLKV